MRRSLALLFVVSVSCGRVRSTDSRDLQGGSQGSGASMGQEGGSGGAPSQSPTGGAQTGGRTEALPICGPTSSLEGGLTLRVSVERYVGVGQVNEAAAVNPPGPPRIEIDLPDISEKLWVSGDSATTLFEKIDTVLVQFAYAHTEKWVVELRDEDGSLLWLKHFGAYEESLVRSLDLSASWSFDNDCVFENPPRADWGYGLRVVTNLDGERVELTQGHSALIESEGKPYRARLDNARRYGWQECEGATPCEEEVFTFELLPEFVDAAD